MGNCRKSPHIDIVRRAQSMGVDAPWYRLLSVAIISRAVLDWRYLDDNDLIIEKLPGGYTSRAELTQFAESDWCTLLMQGFEGWTSTFIERVVTRNV